MITLEQLVEFFQNYGYFSVFSVLILCGFGLPIPEDVALVAGGVISGLGSTNVHTMFALCMAGVLLGDGMMFSLGYFFGEKLMRIKWIKKILSPERFMQIQEKFTKYGLWLIVAARFMPGLRSPIFVATGITRRVSFFKFFMIDGFTSLISVPVWVYLGYFGAANLDVLLDKIHKGQKIVLILVVLIILAIITKIWYTKFKKKIIT